MAKKESGEDILRTILEKGGMNPISSSSIQNAIQDAGGTLKGSISTPLTQSGLIPPPPITAEGSGSSKKSEALLENQKKTLEDIKKNTGNTAKMLDSLIKIQKTYNDDSKSLIKSLLESNEAQRIAVEENNRSKEVEKEKTTNVDNASKGEKNKNKNEDSGSGGFLDKIADLFGIGRNAGGSVNPSNRPANARTGPGVGSRLLRGGLVGGGAMAAYSLLGPDQQKTLEEKGVDSTTVGVLGTAAGIGGPAGVLMAAGYGLLKLIEYSGKVEKEREEKRKAIYDAGNVDVPHENFKYENRTFEQGGTPEETEANRQSYESRLNRERMDLNDAPFLTKYYGLDRGKYLESKQNEREQQFFNRRANAGNLQAANEGVTVTDEVTPSTENPPPAILNQIFQNNNTDISKSIWQKNNQDYRTRLLEAAEKRGVKGINAHPENGARTPTSSSRMEIPNAYEVEPAQSRFDKITSEAMSTAPQPQSSAPIIINGGSTVNNITTTSSGGGRGGGGSPSRAVNPWDSTLFGSKWEPYY
jgi:hypothetical protein